jgi:hypothetical protein
MISRAPGVDTVTVVAERRTAQGYRAIADLVLTGGAFVLTIGASGAMGTRSTRPLLIAGAHLSRPWSDVIMRAQLDQPGVKLDLSAAPHGTALLRLP